MVSNPKPVAMLIEAAATSLEVGVPTAKASSGEPLR
jgi:hypothetical protein